MQYMCLVHSYKVAKIILPTAMYVAANLHTPVSEKKCTQRIKKRNLKKYIHMGKITLAEVSKTMIIVPDSQKQPALNNDVVRIWSKSWK